MSFRLPCMCVCVFKSLFLSLILSLSSSLLHSHSFIQHFLSSSLCPVLANCYAIISSCPSPFPDHTQGSSQVYLLQAEGLFWGGSVWGGPLPIVAHSLHLPVSPVSVLLELMQSFHKHSLSTYCKPSSYLLHPLSLASMHFT